MHAYTHVYADAYMCSLCRMCSLYPHTHVYADAYMCPLCRMCSLYSYTHVYADASLLQDGDTPLALAKSQGHGEMEALLRQHGGT